MATLTIRSPNDTHERLRQLARHRGLSLNQLFEEFSTAGLAEFDAETRFRLLAAQGDLPDAVAALDKLDAHFRREDE